MLIYFNRYQIMIQCWNEDPNNRPTFNRLREMTTEFIQEEVGQPLINVTVITVCHIEKKLKNALSLKNVLIGLIKSSFCNYLFTHESLKSSWELVQTEMLVFEERGKPEYPDKNLSEQETEPTTNSTKYRGWTNHARDSLIFNWWRCFFFFFNQKLLFH